MAGSLRVWGAFVYTFTVTVHLFVVYGFACLFVDIIRRDLLLGLQVFVLCCVIFGICVFDMFTVLGVYLFILLSDEFTLT